MGRGGLHLQNGGEDSSGGPTKGSSVGPGAEVAGPEPTPKSWGLIASPRRERCKLGAGRVCLEPLASSRSLSLHFTPRGFQSFLKSRDKKGKSPTCSRPHSTKYHGVTRLQTTRKPPVSSAKLGFQGTKGQGAGSHLSRAILEGLGCIPTSRAPVRGARRPCPHALLGV